MDYPLISEYLEAVKAAVDNFDQLKNLRPVLGEDGEPVMSGGNFAVVFKMKDEQTGKLHAVKCFLKEQEGRAEAYRLISEELEYVSSTFLTPIKYLDNELFVDTNSCEQTEFPVLLMDWVEGQTLDKYIREHIDDQYELSLLAYQFSRLATWLMPQPFAHGDLKPDNILVRNDGTLALVDYDGMYVPAMKSQKARELGSPDFRHPSRTEDDFDEHIDDFSLVSILLSLKAIALQPELFEQYGAKDRLLFSVQDYRNLSESQVMDALKIMMHDTELATLYSLFILSSAQNNLSQASFRLLNLNRPKEPVYYNLSTEVTEEDLANAWTDEYGVMYSADRKRLLDCNLGELLCNEWYWNYSIKEGTKVICDNAFNFSEISYHNGETVVSIPEGVICIGHSAFVGLSLRSVVIPKSIKAIANDAFKNNVHLNSIIVDERNSSFDSRNNCNAIIETKSNILIVGCASTIIPSTVDRIGNNAFYGCLNLKSVTLPNNLKSIGDYAFYGCENLKPFTLPNGIESVGDFAFDFEYMLLPDSVLYIGNGYYNKYSKKRFYATKETKERILNYHSDYICLFDETVSTKVDFDNAWEDEKGAKYSSDKRRLLSVPTNLTEYIIKEGTEILCDYAFVGGSRSYFKKMMILNEKQTIKVITIPNSVKSIGKYAFSGCSNLIHIYIPTNTKNDFNILLPEYEDKLIEKDDSEDLSTEVTDEDLANAWTDEFGVKYSKDGKRLLKAPELLKEYSIIEGTAVICDSAFHYCKLESISIPDSVKKMGTGAFAACKEICTIVLPEKLTYIGNCAFTGCESLETIIVPHNVKSIGFGAFSKCKSLTSINIPEKILRIEQDVFSDCKSLSSITIPSNIREIGFSAFDGCRSLTSLIIPDSILKIENHAFSGCKELKSILIPRNVKEIGDAVFSGCDNLISITVDEDNCIYDSRNNCNAIIETKKNCLIAGCSSTLIPNNISIIGKCAFFSCEGLSSIVIPESVRKIEDAAFVGSSIVSIKFSGYINWISASAFKNCYQLRRILVKKEFLKRYEKELPLDVVYFLYTYN